MTKNDFLLYFTSQISKWKHMSELLSVARGLKHSYSLSNKQIKYISSRQSPCNKYLQRWVFIPQQYIDGWFVFCFCKYILNISNIPFAMLLHASYHSCCIFCPACVWAPSAGDHHSLGRYRCTVRFIHCNIICYFLHRYEYLQ